MRSKNNFMRLLEIDFTTRSNGGTYFLKFLSLGLGLKIEEIAFVLKFCHALYMTLLKFQGKVANEKLGDYANLELFFSPIYNIFCRDNAVGHKLLVQ